MTAVVTKTLAQLLDDTRFRANQLNATPNGGDDTRITGLLNERAQEMHDLILSVDNSYYVKPYLFSLPDPVLQALYTAQNLGTAPVNWSVCPGGYYKDTGLDMTPSLPTPITCHNFDFPERNNTARRGWHTYRPVGRSAGVQVLEHLCGSSSQNTAGDYRLWYVGRAPVLAPVTFVDMSSGTSTVIALTFTWTFAHAAFTQDDVGTYLVVAGAASAGNNGTWLITSVVNETTVTTTLAVGLVDETLGTAVTVSYQQGGTVNRLDDVQQIWNKYLSVGAAMELLGIEESDEGPLAASLTSIRARILNMAANRTSEPGVAPVVETFGGSYLGEGYQNEPWNT